MDRIYIFTTYKYSDTMNSGALGYAAFDVVKMSEIDSIYLAAHTKSVCHNRFLLAHVNGLIHITCRCLSVVCLSTVHLVVISWKLSKIEPLLLWNTIQQLALRLFLQHSDPPQTPAWGDIPSNKNFPILIQPPIWRGVGPLLLITERVRVGS